MFALTCSAICIMRMLCSKRGKINGPVRKTHSSVLVSNNPEEHQITPFANFRNRSHLAVRKTHQKGTTFLRKVPMAFPRGYTTNNRTRWSPLTCKVVTPDMLDRTRCDVFCDRHDAKGYHSFAKGANGISQGLYDQNDDSVLRRPERILPL